MHQGNTQSDTEKDLMEWFDRQETDTKWRISACLINTGRPMAEILRDLKALEETHRTINLIHVGSRQRH